MADEQLDTGLSKGILTEFDSTWKMLQTSIEKIPDDKWHSGVGKWFYSYNVYHIIETVHFYINNDPKDLKWGERAGYEWTKDTDIEKDVLHLISKDLVQSYIQEITNIVVEKMKSTPDEEFFEKDGFYWFNSLFERMIYTLRHSAHHIGELSRALRELKLESIKWT
ncbi:MAG: hypothetical protein ACW97A_11270 [Candidatus Thorarchaeota archaeon]|jgi:uncharacterized damage-inducible protein DinB